MGDTELVGEGIFECDVGSWGGSVGVGYESTASLRKTTAHVLASGWEEWHTAGPASCQVVTPS